MGCRCTSVFQCHLWLFQGLIVTLYAAEEVAAAAKAVAKLRHKSARHANAVIDAILKSVAVAHKRSTGAGFETYP